MQSLSRPKGYRRAKAFEAPEPLLEPAALTFLPLARGPRAIEDETFPLTDAQRSQIKERNATEKAAAESALLGGRPA